MEEEKRKRPTIGVMLGDIGDGYIVDLLRGVYSCAKEEGANIIFMAGIQIPHYCIDILGYNSEDEYNYQFNAIYDYVHFMKVDALTVASSSISHCYYNYDREDFLKKYVKVPYMLIQECSKDERVPYMVSDNYIGMYHCVEHLVRDHGYKKIAFLGGPEVNPEAIDRLAAYRDVMEAYGLDVEDDMVAHGNFTELVEHLVVRLFDKNPGLEAIACANDCMAKACYKVCQSRNLAVGKDIAITGFDDGDLAKRMQPLLTSVSQRSFQFGYKALKKTIALSKGENVNSEKVPTILRKRGSCGCGNGVQQEYIALEDLEEYLEKKTSEIADFLLSDVLYEKDKQQYTTLIKEFFFYIYRTVIQESEESFELDKLLKILKKLVDYPRTSERAITVSFWELLHVMVAKASAEAREQMINILEATQEFINNSISNKTERNMKDLNRKAWFVPSFTRDLNRKGSKEDMREVMRPLMERFQIMNVRSCYIYLFDEPVTYEKDITFRIPDKIYLTAYYNTDRMVCYTRDERPCVTVENGFSSIIQSEEAAVFTSFLLFSGEKQYGILLAEVEQEDISFLQVCGMQIGSLLRYIELNQTEQESYHELQKSLRVIQEKNNILSFISEYDQLSQLLNRRGFMEKAISVCKQNDGRKGYLVFCDLDRLKEINDKFGHAAGDFAIKSASERLIQVFPKKSVIARIGGDEFIVLVFSEMPGFEAAIRTQIKEAGEVFNQNQDIPYYVEISVGIYSFYCEPQIDLNEIIQKSDELLYEAKKVRRSSICK